MQESIRAYEHSGFILRLILDGSQIKFEPEFNDFEVVLVNVFDVMIKAVGVVPRVETKLYAEWVSHNFSIIYQMICVTLTFVQIILLESNCFLS